MARGDEVWCQLFSEPSAGSDLASLATRAIRDGNRWRICGQKVWSSFGTTADRGFLLARTDPDVPKRAGITALVVDMHAEGVDARPLRQMTGEIHFAEVFFDDVLVDDVDRIGPAGDGWNVAQRLLSNERQVLAGRASGPVTRVGGIGIDELLDAARAATSHIEPDRLVQTFIRDRVASLVSERLGDRSEMAPLIKLLTAEHNRSMQELAVHTLGMSAVANDGSGDGPAVSWGFLRSRANTIAGGTSEILRSVISERLLGLPREPDPFRGRPWKEIPRG
jgi:alkylation response protein AidB-like acyl-CoA dehydrogenase